MEALATLSDAQLGEPRRNQTEGEDRRSVQDRLLYAFYGLALERFSKWCRLSLARLCGEHRYG